MTVKRIVGVVLLSFMLGTLTLGIIFVDDLGIREIPLEELKKRYNKTASDYVTIDGTDVHYCDEGSGPTIVALHGIADSLYTWDGWREAIGDHYRFVRMDLPGFGLTGPVRDGVYSAEMFVRFLDRFVAELGIDRFILVGNSLGGAIAWNYALAFPDKVVAMILIDPAGYPMDLPWQLRMATLPVIKHAATLISPKWVFRKSLEDVFGDPEKVSDDMIDRAYELNLRPGNRQALIAILEQVAHLKDDPAFSRRITSIAVPTLLLWGEEDRWIPVSHLDRWQADLPGAHAIVYSGVGHVPQMEIPSLSANDADRWLSTLRTDQPVRRLKVLAFAIAAVVGIGLVVLVAVWFGRRR